MSELQAAIAEARAYARSDDATEAWNIVASDDAERRVREYAGHYGVPDLNTLVRLGRDAAEYATDLAWKAARLAVARTS